jgi:hypothetical protein
VTQDEAELEKLRWRGTWICRVDSGVAISSLSNFWALELAPIDEKNITCMVLVAWPDPSSIHVELFGTDGSSVEFNKLRDILAIGERIFKQRYEEAL